MNMQSAPSPVRSLVGAVALTISSLCLAGTTPAPAPAPAPAVAAPPAFDARKVFEDANAEFRKAVDLASRDPGAAAEAAARASAGYREIAARTGVRNHALEINAGNASLLAGDLGHAVAAFRRAERLRPQDASVRASLAAARAKVGLRVEPDIRTRVGELLLAWRGYLGRTTLLWMAVGGYLGAWTTAAFRWWRGRPGVWAGATLASLALVAGGLLAADDWDRRATRDGVIIAGEVIGRSGPGEGLYEASFKQPLRAGVECRVLEQRGAWSRVRLLDGRETWVPGGTVEELKK